MSKVRTQVMLDLDVFNAIIQIQQDLKAENISQTINKFIKQTIIKANDTLELQNVYKWKLEQKDKIIDAKRIENDNLRIQLEELKKEKKPTPKREKNIKIAEKILEGKK